MIGEFVSCLRDNLHLPEGYLFHVGDELRQILRAESSALKNIGQLHREVAVALADIATGFDWDAVMPKYEEFQAEYGIPIRFPDDGSDTDKMCTYVYTVAESDNSTFGSMGHGDDQIIGFRDWVVKAVNTGGLVKAAETLHGYAPRDITDRKALLAILNLHSWAELFSALELGDQRDLYKSLGGTQDVTLADFPLHLACAVYLTGIAESFHYLDLG